MKTRGKRADEMIEILRLVCGGGGPQWVEYHGTYYDFDRLMMAPAPDLPGADLDRWALRAGAEARGASR